MGWADAYIKDLLAEKVVSFRPYGNSMLPLVKSGALVTCAPTRGELGMSIGHHDIVLCEVNGKQYLHQIKMARGDARRGISNISMEYLIARADGTENGWITQDFIYGKLIAIDEKALV